VAQLLRELLGPLSRFHELGEVPFGDHLADAGAKGLAEQLRLDALTDQEHTQGGAQETLRLREGQSRVLVDPRAHHDDVDVGRGVERAAQVLDAGDDHQPRAQGSAQACRRVCGRLEGEHGHRSTYENRFRSVTGVDLPVLDCLSRRPK
jgi:hypothetical protein